MDWEQVWREHWKEIYRFVYYRVRNRQEAEDVAQETFLRLIRSEARYANLHGSLIGLLKTTARNLLIDQWRKRGDHRLLPLAPELEGCSDEPGPEELAERRDEVKRALALLKGEQRLVVQYRLLEGYSVKETAQRMGKSEAAVKTMQFRAIDTVRRLLLAEEQAPDKANGLPPAAGDGGQP